MGDMQVGEGESTDSDECVEVGKAFGGCGCEAS